MGVLGVTVSEQGIEEGSLDKEATLTRYSESLYLIQLER